MITVNGFEYSWEEGMTAESMLAMLKEEGKFNYLLTPFMMLIVNNGFVPASEYPQKAILDGDRIKLSLEVTGG
ncbi:MoaD/ThiS family protein [Dehalobacter sp. DCM]|uniref:sulfur carrier protein ThiS n=1 Tax=Dehalobacter sp. DCM TaxID=2907827 RepID=UPI00308120D2|nr:MoaD/ThiS family protein [Dehalobacter sp. DCM]